ncbi:MAG TPA: sugar ABC transporter substrate-binding protein, partial [Cellulomonas sp.]|nr:sugar ABC transporter substrate-binding protein [Cellulomonas sp.]
MSVAPLRRRWIAIAGTAAALTLVVSGCTSNTPDDTNDDASTPAVQPGASGGNDEPGDKVVIGFSAPAADHGWMGAITKGAVAEAAKYSDVE